MIVVEPTSKQVWTVSPFVRAWRSVEGSALSLIVNGPRGSRGVLRRVLGTCAWRLPVLDAGGRTDGVLDVLSKYRAVTRRSHSVCKAHPMRLGDEQGQT